MRRKIYLVQPTYRDREGRLLQGRSLFTHSLAIPALSAALPPEWEREFCLEYFEDVDYGTDAPVVGISCMVCDAFHGREIAEEFRRRGKAVLLGGCAAELWSRVIRPLPGSLVLGNPGPGEMRGILADAEAGRLAPEYRCGTDVDFPFDYSVFAGRRISFLPALGSIGCRNQCEFCSTAAMGRGRYHLRRLDCVVADLRSIRRSTRRVAFVDTNLYNDRAHLVELCERMIAQDAGLLWGGECTLSVVEDPEVLALLRRAGCRLLIAGIETVDQANLRGVGKPNVVRRYGEQIRRIREAGIQVGGFLIFGFDGDDPGTADALFRFVRESGIAVPLVNILTPVPGTRLFERLKAEGRIRMADEAEFLRQNLLYDTPMYRCYYTPKRMSPEEAEAACLGLRERLSTLPEILRRSLDPSPRMTAVLLRMNLGFRAETRAIARALQAGKGDILREAPPRPAAAGSAAGAPVPGSPPAA